MQFTLKSLQVPTQVKDVYIRLSKKVKLNLVSLRILSSAFFGLFYLIYNHFSNLVSILLCLSNNPMRGLKEPETSVFLA